LTSSAFLGLGGLFPAHITGNLVILASHIVDAGEAPVTSMLAVPVFIVMLGLTRLLMSGLKSLGFASLRPLLLLQLMLLAVLFFFCFAVGSHVDPNATSAVLAGMLGVSAMAVQNALVEVSLKGAPATAVMTTSITRFAMDLGEVLPGRDPGDIAEARRRANHTWPAIVGFAVGCGLGAASEAAFGLLSLALPCSPLQWDLRPSPPWKTTHEPSQALEIRAFGAVMGSMAVARGLANALRSATPPLLFGFRLWAAVCLALYIAFWLQLDNASWAGRSAAIVCQPNLGASLRKPATRSRASITWLVHGQAAV
jgi:uncharacterized membrane protein YoaK (UPF0700 family)